MCPTKICFGAKSAFSVSLLKLKTFEVDSGLLVQNLIQSSHHLEQVWESSNLVGWAY